MIPIVASDTGLTSEAKAAAERRDRAARAGGTEHLADLPALLQRDQERRLPAGQLHADVLELGGEIAGLPPQVSRSAAERRRHCRRAGAGLPRPIAPRGRCPRASAARRRRSPSAPPALRCRRPPPAAPRFAAQPCPDLSCSLIALTATASIAGRISAATSGLTPSAAPAPSPRPGPSRSPRGAPAPPGAARRA